MVAPKKQDPKIGYIFANMYSKHMRFSTNDVNLMRKKVAKFHNY